MPQHMTSRSHRRSTPVVIAAAITAIGLIAAAPSLAEAQTTGVIYACVGRLAGVVRIVSYCRLSVLKKASSSAGTSIVPLWIGRTL